jgi:hypothetical protein
MRVQSFPSLLLLAFLLASAQGCDKGGIYPLNAELDVSCTGVKSTWLRSVEETDDAPGGTELFFFTKADPSEVVGDPPPRGNCFVRAFIHTDSSTDLEQGTYTMDASGKGVFSVLHTYSMTYQDDTVRIGLRPGAKRDDQPSPSSHAITVQADGDQIVLGFDGEKRRLTNIYDVVQNLDPNTAEGRDDVFRFLNLAIYTSAVRIVGFGGLGMSSYLGSVSHFVSLVTNEYSVEVRGKLTQPNTYLTYSQFEDLNGVIVDGAQLSATDISGTGDLSGILTWRIRGSDDPDDIALEGTLDYEGVHVKNGVASSGTYTFTIEGEEPSLVSYALAADLDLQTVLPVESP